jgi:hypothetical protein
MNAPAEQVEQLVAAGSLHALPAQAVHEVAVLFVAAL